MEQPEFDYNDCGWEFRNDKLQPKWLTLPQVYEACAELVKCGCKTTCAGRCKCRNAGFDCTELPYVDKILRGFNFADDENVQFRVDLISRLRPS